MGDVADYFNFFRTVSTHRRLVTSLGDAVVSREDRRRENLGGLGAPIRLRRTVGTGGSKAF